MTQADEQRAEFLADVEAVLRELNFDNIDEAWAMLLRVRARLLAAPLAVDLPPLPTDEGDTPFDQVERNLKQFVDRQTLRAAIKASLAPPLERWPADVEGLDPE
jgi:hypothetical protein